ncbi:hypothetical protein ACGFY0_34100 [Streptomyces chartreusis]|uniref:hypothetical protein n=1 Tax=Streptomyces chartreusis TaxID=1969 RepID=UPI00370FD22F
MTTSDYLIAAVLILLLIPQIHGTRQTLGNALLPVVALAAAPAYCVKSFPNQGKSAPCPIRPGHPNSVPLA